MANENKQAYIDFIIECFENGAIERGEVMAMVAKKWQMSVRTFDRNFKKAKDKHSERRREVEKEKLNTTIEQENEAIKKGLKTKFDRLMVLQNLVEKCNESIESGLCSDTFFSKDDGAIETTRKMNQRELNDTMKTLHTLQSEISKIQGDYAPTKTETDLTTKGESLKPKKSVKIVFKPK